MKKIKKVVLKKSKLLTFKNLLIFSFVLLIPLIKINADELVLASVGITVSPSTICIGESATLDWSSTDATDISISPNIGSVSPYGNQNVSPQNTTTYTINGSNSTGGFGTANVTLRVSSCQNTTPPPPNIPPPNDYINPMPIYSTNISNNPQTNNTISTNINSPSSSNSSVVINTPTQNPSPNTGGQNNYQINNSAPIPQNNYYQNPYQYNYPQQYIQYPYTNYNNSNPIPNYPTPNPQIQTIEKIVKVYPKEHYNDLQSANLIFLSPIKNMNNINSLMPSNLLILLFIIFIILLFMLLMRNMSNRRIIINRNFD